MPTYETIFITPPNLAEDDERATVENLAQIVTAGGGTFTVQERMGRRRLAYPIKKHEDGVYIRLLYDSGADVPKELERRFRLSDKVLRYLTVHLDPDWAQYEKQEAVREAKRRAEAEAAEAARQQAAKEEAERKAAAEAEEAAKKAAEAEKAEEQAAESDEEKEEPAESPEASDGKPAAEAAPASDEESVDETTEPPAADEAETEKA